MSVIMWIATSAWVCLVFGYLMRKNKRAHIALMIVGISIDLALVFYLQLTRDAIQKAVGFDLGLGAQLHIIFSSIAGILYFPVIYFGYRLIKVGPCPRLLFRHKALALPALAARSVGFFFMFSMWHE